MGLLRTMLALAVVLAHSPLNSGQFSIGGVCAVHMFYMISGFLISYVVNSNPSYREPLRFYASRALRLYPVYFAALGISLIAAFALNWNALLDVYRSAPWSARALLVFSNLALFGQDWIMFLGVHDGRLAFVSDFRSSDVQLFQGLLVPQAWTLGVELSFYAIAPFILRRKGAMAVLLLASFAVRGWLFAAGLGMKDPWVYRFFPAELSLFLLGAFSQQVLLPLWERVCKAKGFWLGDAATAFLAAFCLVFLFLPVPLPLKALALYGSFIALLPLTFIFQRRRKLDKAIGELSYPLYVGHLVVIEVFAALCSKASFGSPLGITAAELVLALGFAHLLNAQVARRVESFRDKVKGGRGSSAGTAN